MKDNKIKLRMVKIGDLYYIQKVYVLFKGILWWRRFNEEYKYFRYWSIQSYSDAHDDWHENINKVKGLSYSDAKKYYHTINVYHNSDGGFEVIYSNFEDPKKQESKVFELTRKMIAAHNEGDEEQEELLFLEMQKLESENR